MKHLSIIILTFVFASCVGQTKRSRQSSPLFLITNLDKAGFIDSTGRVVIEPKFRTAGEFSEGLAHARINGTYGYIDNTGNFVIQPQYDYATPFSEGLAIVYKDGKPFYINAKGQKAFECNFLLVSQFVNGRAVVKTATNKLGVVNKQGALLIDTVFSSLGPFNDGLAVVRGIEHHPYTEHKNGIKKKYEVGVIDTLGRFVIPYGGFTEIADYENGFFRAEIPAQSWDTVDGYSAQTAIIDRNGKTILSKDYRNHCYIDGNVHCGLAKMSLYRYWIPEEKDAFSTEKSYDGYMNLKGAVFINDTTFETAEDFSDNRAFVRDKDGHYSVINTQGKFAAQNAFNDIIGHGFKDGVAFVAVDGKWGLIDTNVNFIIKPQFRYINEIGMIGDYFFFEEYDKSGNDKLTGVARKDGRIIIKPVMQEFDRSGFKNGLLRCVVDGKLTYLNKSGKTIWQEKSSASDRLSSLNIDHMNRGYFYAYSLPNEKERSGGWAKSANIPQKMSKTQAFPQNALSVTINTTAKDSFSKTYNGFSVYVANNTGRAIDFSAQDSRLYMKVQALNSKGEWKDIEYLPSSWCGNSYHTLTLEPKYFWAFTTPKYEGDYKTKLRIELKYIDRIDKSEKRLEKKEITIYSNEYEASVNPGQFWRKQDYYPNGLMDPYND